VENSKSKNSSMKKNPFKNKKILITAGPTREAIDPVRYISNHSSGKMGYALAEAFLSRGAEVYLVSGPVTVKISHPRLVLTKVNSASEMYLACCRFFEEADIAVFAAAVADYRPERISTQKIKKNDRTFTMKLVKNVDIAYEFSDIKASHQLSIGFALETNDEWAHAVAKLTSKKFDMLILNSMKDENATFGFDTNKITVVKNNLSRKDFPLKNKREVADDILTEISSFFPAKEKDYLNESVYAYENMYR
jgi:phosphopantothenoylcysteine decarboxylase/phosphopantothenate--cysteine ligase